MILDLFAGPGGWGANDMNPPPVTLTIGSLFSGYGGLDMGVSEAVGAHPIWHAEIELAPSKILAHHWPHVPNLGDITKVDWSQVERPDIITGGFPCQDVSLAGRRAGLGAGTRTGLWSAMANAIDTLRPSLVVAENVRGLLSAAADSDVEPCPWCVGDGSDPALRALGAVLADLADIGYDAAWCGLPASAVGAPHGRFRVFVVAWPADSDGVGCQWFGGSRIGRGGPAHDGGAVADTTHDDRHRGSGVRATGRRQGGVTDRPAADAESDRWDEGRPESAGLVRGPNAPLGGNDVATDWGTFGPAISRWESVLGRPSPPPTSAGRKGTQRLSAVFVEFLMGLPAGHITDVPGISRNEQLKALGNGVVPQQAAAAIRYLQGARA